MFIVVVVVVVFFFFFFFFSIVWLPKVTDEPMVAIRKFSPCGRYLVTFSKSPGVYSLVVYRMRRAVRNTQVGQEAQISERNSKNFFFFFFFLASRELKEKMY